MKWVTWEHVDRLACACPAAASCLYAHTAHLLLAGKFAQESACQPGREWRNSLLISMQRFDKAGTVNEQALVLSLS
jgi:hypothetical protein